MRVFSRSTGIVLSLGALFALGACSSLEDTPEPLKAEVIAPAPKTSDLALVPVSFAALPFWEDDQVVEALPALRKSCERFARMNDQRQIGPNGVGGRAGEWKPVCQEAFSLVNENEEQARTFFQNFFQPYLISDLNDDDPAQGLFTGYYEASLRGARSKGGRFQTPLYKRPTDLVLVGLGEFRTEWRGKRLAGRIEDGRLVPYANRAEIEAGKLRGKNLELVWVDDPVDAFFLHIQGSGRVQFEDGSTMRVGYDGHNGHNYTSIGRILIEEGEIAREAMSMQAIRKWLSANPRKGQDLMRENGSFIFFRKLEGDGPIGAQGAALTAGRSLAVDKRYLPYGIPMWVHTFTDPVNPGDPISRLMVAQDTGGAIKGVVRGDLFWGYGEEAAEIAGKMKERGSYFALLPKNTLTHCTVCEPMEDSPAP